MFIPSSPNSASACALRSASIRMLTLVEPAMGSSPFCYQVHYMLIVWMNDIGEDEKLYTNIAYTIGYIISWLCNFYLSAHFTFKEKTSVKRGIGFALSHGVNYLLHLIFLNFFLWLGVSESLAPIPVFCIVIPINFLLVRFVFKSKQFEK